MAGKALNVAKTPGKQKELKLRFLLLLLHAIFCHGCHHHERGLRDRDRETERQREKYLLKLAEETDHSPQQPALKWGFSEHAD
jgi:hypothetical protein